MSEVLSFAENCCWEGETFRQTRPRVVFSAYSIGNNLGVHFQGEFESDFGLWYEIEDNSIMAKMHELAPEVLWGAMVFYKRLDQSCIEVFETFDDRLVARIEVRKYGGRRLDLLERDDLGPNVIRFSDIPARLAEIRMLEEEKRIRRELRRGEYDRGEIGERGAGGGEDRPADSVSDSETPGDGEIG